jgi:glycosyltransferase involved in cell wall biosynthesis
VRVCLAGSYAPGFPRNRQTRRLLELAGHTVTSCRVEIWSGDRVELAARGKARAVLRSLLAYPLLVWRLLAEPVPDVYVVGYPGWFDVPIVKLVASLRRRPVVFDMFISLYDTAVQDRSMFSPGSLVGRLARTADRWSCHLSDRVILDTPAHAEYMVQLTGVERERFGVVWLGANDELFWPRIAEMAGNHVLFHGTFVPLQGLETIVRAAKLLEPDNIEVRIVGDGQDRERVDALMAELRPSNVDMTGLLPAAEIPGQIANAAVCLGIFGRTSKAQRVIPNKVFECVAVGQAVVTADTPAMRSGFLPGEVALVPVADPEALANAVRTLLGDEQLRNKIASAGLVRYKSSFEGSVLSRLLDDELRAVTRA